MATTIKFDYFDGKSHATYFVDDVKIPIVQNRCKVQWDNGITESLNVVERHYHAYDTSFDNGGYPTSTTVYLDAEIVFNGTLLTVPLEQLPLVVS